MVRVLRLVVWVCGVTAAAWWLWSDVSWAATPEAQVMGVVRVVAAVLATWLVAATVLAVLGGVLRVRWLGLLAPAVVRRLVAGALAGGLLFTPGVAAASGAGGAGGGGTALPVPPPGVEVPVLERLTPAAEPDVVSVPSPVAPVPLQGERIVEPGDHLWGIAEAELSSRLGRSPTDAEVVPYWRQLIDANRVVVGPDPNLIHPGQKIDLPS
ncbi:MAG TPA: LysM domain-containing protein [Acidimicrobiales bacterium]|nr:LysM domain-containing protein [Acidimicrobiales bacterium]